MYCRCIFWTSSFDASIKTQQNSLVQRFNRCSKYQHAAQSLPLQICVLPFPLLINIVKNTSCVWSGCVRIPSTQNFLVRGSFTCKYEEKGYFFFFFKYSSKRAGGISTEWSFNRVPLHLQYMTISTFGKRVT